MSKSELDLTFVDTEGHPDGINVQYFSQVSPGVMYIETFDYMWVDIAAGEFSAISTLDDEQIRQLRDFLVGLDLGDEG